MRTAIVSATVFMFACVAGRMAAQESAPTAVTGQAASAAPVRLALISGVRHKTALDAIALAEVQLSAIPGLKLLERATIDKVLEEHQLVFQGMADAALAVKTGKILAVDLLAVLEGDPKAKDNAAFGLIVFDARTGARLCDEALPGGPADRLAAALAAPVDDAAGKFRGGPRAVKTVSVLSARNVDLPLERDALCEAVAQLLERGLVSSPDVTVLERKYLEQVRNERAITPQAPANALLASLETVHLECERAGEAGCRVTAILADPAGQQRRVTAELNYDSPAAGVKSLQAAVLGEIHAASPKRKPDLKAEAGRLFDEADYETEVFRNRQAAACAEAALALAPDDPAILKKAATCFWVQSRAMTTDKKLTDLPAQMPLLFQFGSGVKAEPIEQATAYAVRMADCIIQLRQYEAGHGGIRVRASQINRVTQPEIMLQRQIGYLAQVREVSHVKAGPLNDALLGRYRHLMLDILIPYCIKRSDGKKFDNQYMQTYALMMTMAPSYATTSKAWTDLMVQHAERVLRLVDRKGTVRVRSGMIVHSHIFWLAIITACGGEKPAPEDDRRLQELFQAMTRHRLASTQIFGRSAIMWLDRRMGRLSPQALPQRAREVLDFARQKIEDPALPEGERERAACYEAALNVIDTIPKDVALPLLGDLVRLMIARKEVSLQVVRMVSLQSPEPYDHYNCQLTLLFGDPSLFRWNVGDNKMVYGFLTRLKALMSSPDVRLLEGEKALINNRLREELEEFGRRFPELAGSSPPAWSEARQLVLCQGDEQSDMLSRPVVRDGDMYVLELFRTPKGGPPPRLELLKVALDGRSTQRVSTLTLHFRPDAPDWYAAYQSVSGRFRAPLRSPQISNGCLYCSLVDRGGIAVFPLDGAKPRIIGKETVPGMPIDIFDDIVVVGKKIFALTAGPTSYVHWYDPDGGGWQVIASSRRVNAETPLDCHFHALPGAVYDPYHDRVLFGIVKAGGSAGIYQFSVKDRKISLLKTCAAPDWMEQVDADRVLLAFAGRAPGDTGWREKLSRIVEYDMKADRWTEVFRAAGQSAEVVADAVRCRRPCTGNPDIAPPTALVDGWIWSYYPLARVSPDGAVYQRFREVSAANKESWNEEWQQNPVQTMQYIPQRRGLLIGQRTTIWYLQLPAQPDPPPAGPAGKVPLSERYTARRAALPAATDAAKKAPLPDDTALPPASAKSEWLPLFRSADPTVWNTDSPDKDRFAIPLAKAPETTRFLKLQISPQEFVVIAMTKDKLGVLDARETIGWQGANALEWGGHVLGVFDPTRNIHGAGGCAMVRHGGSEFSGWGFGHHKGQGYTWGGKLIGKTVFEISVTSSELTPDEKNHLLQ